MTPRRCCAQPLKHLGELRYSDFVTAEMVCETMQNVLAKFQPLCHKIVAAASKGEEDQDKISAMIAMVWDEMPIIGMAA